MTINFDGSGGFGAFTFNEFSGDGLNVPFEFSPTIGLLLSGSGLLGMRFLKQRRQSKKLKM